MRVYVCPGAERRLEVASAFLDSLPQGSEALVLGATRRAAEEFLHRRAARQGALFGFYADTLTRLAEELAAPLLAERNLVPARGLACQVVAARTAFKVRQEGRAGYFQPVCSLPGFSRALATTVDGLCLAGIEPRALRRSPPPGPDLAEFFSAYLAGLEERHLADRYQVLEMAREGWPASPLRGLPLLLLDVPLRWPVEAELVRQMARDAPRALAVVPEGDEATLEMLEGFPREDEVEPDSRPLACLRRYLFGAELPPAASPDGSIQFFSAPGEGRECLEIARRLLAEARRGTPFDRMAVAVAEPASYVAALESAFARAGIPAWFDPGTRRPNPAGRAFLALLACAAEGLSARRFAEYLALAQVPLLSEEQDLSVPPRAGSPGFGEDESEAPLAGDCDFLTLRRWEEMLVEASVVGGDPGRWRERLEALDREWRVLEGLPEEEAPDSSRIHELERRRQALQRFSAFALSVVGELAALPHQAYWMDWLACLERLAPRVLRNPRPVLDVLEELRPLEEVGPVDRLAVLQALEEPLLQVQESPGGSRYGRVFVGTPEALRGRSFEVVLVPAMAERMFPRKMREDPLLPDSLAAGLSRSLSIRSRRAAEERLRLRLAVGAARTRLYFSYPRLDTEKGRPRVPSFYGLDVIRASRGRLPDFRELEREAGEAAAARLAWPAPPCPEEALDEFEHDLAVLGGLLKAPAPGRARYLLQTNPHLRRSLRQRWYRWPARPGPWNPSDGLVDPGEPVRQLLVACSLRHHPYSPSALEQFAACPYRFFLYALCRLQPREEITPLQETDPLIRGSLIHETQARFLRRLRQQGAVDRAALERAQPVLDAVLEEVAEEYRARLAPAVPRVWQDEVEAMRTDLRLWRQELARDADTWEPLYGEWSFGLPLHPRRDPASRSEPAVLPGGWRLRGAVDWIERSRTERELRVTDHKTGRARIDAGFAIGGGAVLQPILYAQAVEALLGEEVAESRLFYCTRRGGFEVYALVPGERERSSARRALEIIDAWVRRGFLPPAPREGECEHCDYRVVCGPWEEFRSRRKKSPERLAELEELRGMA